MILHAGNMGHKQGLEVAVEAARLASARGLPWDFVLLGDGNQRARLQARGRDVPTLRFLDPLPSQGFHDALFAADLLLLTDRPGVGSMSVPSKLTSYFGAGRAVLASTDEHGNAATELRAAGAGQLARPGDAEDLLEQARWLHDNPARARRMGRAGRAYCEQNLSVEHSLDQLEAVLSGLAQAGRAGRSTPTKEKVT